MDTIVERLTLGKVVEETMETNRRERLGKQQRRKAMDNDAFIQDMYGGQDWGFSSLMGEGITHAWVSHARQHGTGRIVGLCTRAHMNARTRAHTSTRVHTCTHISTQSSPYAGLGAGSMDGDIFGDTRLLTRLHTYTLQAGCCRSDRSQREISRLNGSSIGTTT